MIPGLVAHLWQSTLFAGVAWLLTLTLRRNPAQLRHRILFIASAKFLIPFSLLVGLGTLVPQHATAPRVQIGWVAAAEQIGQPLFTFPATASRVAVTSEGASHGYVAVVLFVLWVFGFTAITICWLVRWRRVHVLRKSAELVRIEFPVAVMSAAGLIEPGIFGIFRAVLLLPEGIEGRIGREQLDAILAHELCHIRRRDNLTATIHMAVQAIFWFHPLVWWLGVRLVDERERACDEEVLLLGSKPQVYAAGILNVCKLYVETPLACVSGVTGADLKKRIEAIMHNGVAVKLNFARRAALAVAGIAALAGPIMIGMVNAPDIRAQVKSSVGTTATSLPRFEVASIKLNTSGTGRFSIGSASPTPGRFNMENVPLRFLVEAAWNVQDFQISGGPGWASSDRYDVKAKAPTPVGFEAMRPMIRALLEDRFRLAIHRESKDSSVYALVVGKGGTKLKASKEGSCVTASSQSAQSANAQDKSLPVCGGIALASRGSLTGTGISMAQLATALSNILKRTVLDQTRLAGIFDAHMEWTPGSVPSAGADPSSESGSASIFTAIQEQFGLRLESAKGPVEMLVIDHVERPSEN